MLNGLIMAVMINKIEKIEKWVPTLKYKWFKM